MLDAPLAYDARMRGYYYTEESFHLPAIALNDSDLFAVFIAEKVLQQYESTPIYSRLQSLFARIADSLPDKISIDPEQLNGKFSFFRTPHSIISNQVWETVFMALRTSQSLKIHYVKPGISSPSEREIDPYHVISHQGEWYVIAFCHTRRDLRTFALSRIKSSRLTGQYFSIPQDFNFNRIAENHFGIQWSDKNYNVKIWFSATAAPLIRERIWHEGQIIHENKDKSIIMEFSVSHLLEVKRWVLSWGAMARVKAPQSLVDEIINEINQLFEGYGDTYEQRDYQAG